jgi:hypothetical protein
MNTATTTNVPPTETCLITAVLRLRAPAMHEQALSVLSQCNLFKIDRLMRF